MGSLRHKDIAFRISKQTWPFMRRLAKGGIIRSTILLTVLSPFVLRTLCEALKLSGGRLLLLLSLLLLLLLLLLLSLLSLSLLSLLSLRLLTEHGLARW